MDARPPMVRQGDLPHLPSPVGESPSPVNPPSGCAFHARCPKAEAICSSDRPLLSPVGSGHQVACHGGFNDLHK